jgi:hypothetical protein
MEEKMGDVFFCRLIEMGLTTEDNKIGPSPFSFVGDMVKYYRGGDDDAGEE